VVEKRKKALGPEIPKGPTTNMHEWHVLSHN